jgi:hypothetical protein
LAMSWGLPLAGFGGDGLASGFVAVVGIVKHPF